MAQIQATTVTSNPLSAIDFYCRQEANTAALAQQLATNIARLMADPGGAHLNISLEGDLGAGKTTFARYLIQALGHTGKVKSPTYTLCEPYPFQCKDQVITIYHFDLYRMRDPLEWQEAGFAEYFDAPGLCIIEWPEKAEGTLPTMDIQIQLTAGINEHERNIKISAMSPTGNAALKAISVK